MGRSKVTGSGGPALSHSRPRLAVLGGLIFDHAAPGPDINLGLAILRAQRLH
jgi:hypothetical protein